MIQIFSNLAWLLIKVSLMKLFMFWTNVCLAYEHYTNESINCLLKLINKVFGIGINNIGYEFALITSACYLVFIYLLCIRFTVLLVGISADLCGSGFSLSFFVYTSFFFVFRVTIIAKRNYMSYSLHYKGEQSPKPRRSWHALCVGRSNIFPRRFYFILWTVGPVFLIQVQLFKTQEDRARLPEVGGNSWSVVSYTTQRGESELHTIDTHKECG